MARRMRVEFAGARYHVISRGNYRAPVFGDERTKWAFLKCVSEACVRAEWVVHAFVVMKNHYHLALETPRGNLSDGMQWLQSTFATRFNRFRKESGHVFQGRYKAILVQSASQVGAVAHYIHLNPVRAKIVGTEALATYPFSSYAWLQKKQRPSWLNLSAALESAGGLKDTKAGQKMYGTYLSFLCASDEEQRRLQFERLCQGWVLGSRQFEQQIAEEHRQKLLAPANALSETQGGRQALWNTFLSATLQRLGRSLAEAANDRKAADWKVAVAVYLKRSTTVKNPWLAKMLHMGDPDGVSRYVGEFNRGQRPGVAVWLAKITDISV